MINRILILSLLFFYIVALQADEEKENSIDIATCIKDRTHQYSLNGYSRVYVVSPMRTGSTLIYNLLRILFEKEIINFQIGFENSKCIVHKAHNLNKLNKKNKYLYIFTLRNPSDICFSWYRIQCSNGIVNRDMIKKFIERNVNQWQILNKLQDGDADFIILRYEEFVNNLDYVFEQLENALSISIDNQDKNLIKKALSKENVLLNIKNYGSFNEWNPVHHFHGKHVDQNEIAEDLKIQIKNLIHEELLNFNHIFNQWGYTVEPEKG